jgi:hypothetical protein
MSTVFKRGLSQEDALQKPPVVRVLRTVLECHSVDDKPFNKEEKDALKMGSRRGWLHSDFINSDTLYFTPTPTKLTSNGYFMVPGVCLFRKGLS